MNDKAEGPRHYFDMENFGTVESFPKIWYTAWVNAGKPDLSNLDANELTKRNNKSLKKDLRTFEKGNLFGLINEKE